MRKLHLIAFLFTLGINQNILAQTNNIEIKYERNSDKSIDVFYTKKLPGSYYIKIEFENMENCSRSSIKKVIKYESGTIATLKPINSEQHINFSSNLSYLRGEPNPKVDKDFNYVLPFKKNKTVKVFETKNIKEELFTTEKYSKWKSFVTDREYADTIYTMRKGIVVDVVNEFKPKKVDAYEYTNEMNSITVEHKDGTIATYIGFNKDSIFVKPGQVVYPQTKLGILDLFNTTVYRLYFSVSFFTGANFNEKRTFRSKDQMEHLIPSFYTSNGAIQLEHNKYYNVDVNESILLKEFTRKEKKKYKNEPFFFE